MNQKKAKFNIVDILVILVLIAGIVFVGVRMFGGEEPAVSDPATGGKYLVTFCADSVHEDVAATLVQGSKAENASRNMDLGTLIDFSIDVAIAYGTDSKGNVVQGTKPGYVSVTLVCRVTGFQNPTGLQVGQFALNMGHAMGVCAGNTEISTVVCNIVPAATE
jgi:hypothetical protein